MRSRLVVGSTLCLALLAAACGDGINEGVRSTRSDSSPGTRTAGTTGSTGTTDTTTGTTGSTSTTEDPTAAAFGWQESGLDGTVQKGNLKVPIDYKDPSLGTFDLYVTRHKASKPAERIGSLLVNPGGPGFGGSVLAQVADQYFSQDLIDRFDIIGWDPRGTGVSKPAIDCITNYDKYFGAQYTNLAPTQEHELFVNLSKEFEKACIDKNTKIFQYVGTNNSARDMDSIRKALGEDKITYFGFSYGSELGATWVTMFPDTVRAAVLDGAADPNADELQSGLQQTKGFEDALATFLAHCSKTLSCAFNNNGGAEGAFDKLMASLDTKPITSQSGRPDINQNIAISGVVQAMYSQSYWPTLEQALAAAQTGDGAGLLALYDSYYQRQQDGTYDNSLEAFQVISCVDSPERTTVETADADAAKYHQVAPRISPNSVVGSYFCTFFPKSQDPRVMITGTGAGPVLVVGTTGDPATPLASSQNMAKALEGGVLLTVTADQHTGYDVNTCSHSTVDGYLIKLKVPPVGTKC